MSKTAIKPNYFFDFKGIGKVGEVEEEMQENFLASLGNHNGWPVLKDYIEGLIEELEGINKKAMESGATFEEIGRNTIVIQLCKEQLQKVIDRVEDVREQAESGGDTTGSPRVDA